MTIAIVLPQPPGYSETFFRSKIKGLQASGHKVILVTAATDRVFDLCRHIENPKVYKNSISQVFSMLLVFVSLLPYSNRVFKFIRIEQKEGMSFKRIIEKIYINASLLKLKMDWLHFGFATMALERESVAKSIGAKLAVSFRGYDIGVYPLTHPNCYTKLWKFADKVHYISDDLYTKAIKLGLPSTIPAQKIAPAVNSIVFQLKGVNEVEEKPIFLTIGRLHWKKGFVSMLEALSELNKKGIDFEYRIIGEGDDYERIAFAAHQLKISDKIQFLGKLEQKDVISNLEKADYYLQYSIQEGFCNAVLEAQAIGKLCLVSDAEGLSENVIDQQTGWVVPRQNPTYLAEKIVEIIQLPYLVKMRISKAANKRVIKDFNLIKQKSEFLKFYELRNLNTYEKSLNN
jgi:colanic acid/amylovoran biosynthesis glycosyltransferase